MASQPTIQQYILSCYLQERPELCNALYYAHLWGIRPQLDEKTMRAAFIIIRSDLLQTSKDQLVVQLLGDEEVDWEQRAYLDHLIEAIHSYQHDFPVDLWLQDDQWDHTLDWLVYHEKSIEQALHLALGMPVEFHCPLVFYLPQHLELLGYDVDDYPLFRLFNGHELTCQDEEKMAQIFISRFLFAMEDVEGGRNQLEFPPLPDKFGEMVQRREFTQEEKNALQALSMCHGESTFYAVKMALLRRVETLTWEEFFLFLTMLRSQGAEWAMATWDSLDLSNSLA